MKRMRLLSAIAATLVAVGMVLVVTLPVEAGSAPFRASFDGSFTIAFGGCANGDDHLLYRGHGPASHAGKSVIAGDSCLAPDLVRPGCSNIEQDATVLTAANGDVIRLVNRGEDCMTISHTGAVVIQGTATYTIVGGTGRFSGVAGDGAVHNTAEVTSIDAAGVAGTFGPLVFAGSLTRAL
jgi:hypothetical protein